MSRFKEESMKKKEVRRKSLRAKFRFYIFSLTFFCMLLASVIGYGWGRSILMDRMVSEHISIATLLAQSLGRIIAEEIDDITIYTTGHDIRNALSVSNSAQAEKSDSERHDYLRRMDEMWAVSDPGAETVRHILEDPASRKLRAIKRKDPDIAELFVTDRYGALAAAAEKTSDFYQADEVWWQTAFDDGRGKAFVTDFEFDASASVQGLTLAAPLRDDEGRIIGIVKAVLRASRFILPLEQFSFGQTGHLFLTTQDGRVVFDKLSARHSEHMSTNLFPSLLKDSGPRANHITVEAKNKRFSVTLFPVEGIPVSDHGSGWWLFLVQDEAEFLAPLKQLIVLVITLTLFILILCIPLSHFLADLFLRPLKKLHGAAIRISEGHLQEKLEIHTGDEIEDLAVAFSGMTKKLIDSLDQISIFADTLETQVLERTRTLKEARKDLDSSRSDFQNMIMASRDAMLILNSEGCIVFMNDPARNLFDRPDAAALGQPFGFPLTANEPAAIRIVSSDGSVRDAEMTAVPTSWEGSAATLVMLHDITERLKRERLVESVAREWGLIFDSISDMIFLLDHEQKIVRVNRAVSKYFRLEPGDLVGRPFSPLVHETEKLPDACPIQKPEASAEPVKHDCFYESIGIHVEELIAPLPETEESPSRIVIVARDISERKKLEREQRLSQLGGLVSDMAHEVNNPLMIISGNAELSLHEGAREEDIRDSLAIIQNECMRARDIIHRLLTFSRPGKNLRRECDINKTIEAITGLLTRQFSLKNVFITEEFAADLPPVSIDEKQIQEVLMNLLNNARDAMESGGIIRIKTAFEDNAIKIDISDTGLGMDEKTLAQVFEPFFTTKEKGTGLGIPVCFGIIQAHGGILKYKSRLGEGTTATILLPRIGPVTHA